MNEYASRDTTRDRSPRAGSWIFMRTSFAEGASMINVKYLRPPRSPKFHTTVWCDEPGWLMLSPPYSRPNAGLGPLLPPLCLAGKGQSQPYFFWPLLSLDMDCEWSMLPWHSGSKKRVGERERGERDRDKSKDFTRQRHTYRGQRQIHRHTCNEVTVG